MGSHLEQKLLKLGLSPSDGHSGISIGQISRKHCFKLYLPDVKVSDGYMFTAAPAGIGYNFTGKVLGIKGQNAADIAGSTGARIEVCDAAGNLCGKRPDPFDPHLHVLLTSDTMLKIQKAVKILCEQLGPKGGPPFKPFTVVSGGSAKLELSGASPKQPPATQRPSQPDSHPQNAPAKAQYAQPFGHQPASSQAASEAPAGAALKSVQRRATKTYTGARAAPAGEVAAAPQVQAPVAAAANGLGPWQGTQAGGGNNYLQMANGIQQEQQERDQDAMRHWQPVAPQSDGPGSGNTSDSSAGHAPGSIHAAFANLEGFHTPPLQPQVPGVGPQLAQTQGGQPALHAAAAVLHPAAIQPGAGTGAAWPQQQPWPTMQGSSAAIWPAAAGPSSSQDRQISMEEQGSDDLSELLALLNAKA